MPVIRLPLCTHHLRLCSCTVRNLINPFLGLTRIFMSVPPSPLFSSLAQHFEDFFSPGFAANGLQPLGS